MTVTPQMIARSVALGAAGAALSARDQTRLLRWLGLAASAGVGGAVAWGLRTARIEGEGVAAPDGATSPRSTEPVSIPVAVGAGLGVALATAVMSEVGIRGQAWVEDRAERTVGHPRLVVGVGTALLMLVMEVVEQRLDADHGA